MTSEYDVVVIGGGAAGENAAQYATQYSGLTAALVESTLVGGACSYWACMPSKALLRPIAAVHQANRVPGVRAEIVDTDAVLRNRDDVVHHHDDTGQVEWAQSVGIDVIRGRGRLSGTKEVHVDHAGDTRTLTARCAVVLATGSAPREPDLPGLEDVDPWTSDDATAMSEVPESVIILGGGVVACEAATWLAGLGSKVTIVDTGTRLLARHDPHVSTLLTSALHDLGVRVHSSAQLQSVTRPGHIVLNAGPAGTFEAEQLLVATGRIPRRGGLGLEKLGVDVDAWSTDPAMRVDGAADWLYAVGDVNGGATMLTHMGKYQARVAGTDIACRFGPHQPRDRWRPSPHVPDTATNIVTPSVVFTVPEIATVGMSADTARATQRPAQGSTGSWAQTPVGGQTDSQVQSQVEVIEYDLGDLAGASLLDPTFQGWAQFVIDPTTRTLLGATFVGLGAAELVHTATLAIVAQVDLRVLWDVVPSYPTISEVWLRLAEQLRQRGLSAEPSTPRLERPREAFMTPGARASLSS